MLIALVFLQSTSFTGLRGPRAFEFAGACGTLHCVGVGLRRCSAEQHLWADMIFVIKSESEGNSSVTLCCKPYGVCDIIIDLGTRKAGRGAFDCGSLHRIE